MIYIKIALRNILKNRKRTALIGLTLLISCMLLLFSFSIGNGIHRQIVDKYRSFQSGDVAVLWSSVLKYDSSDPSRLFFSNFDIKRDAENRKALKRLHGFLESHASEIRYRFPWVMRYGTLDTGHFALFSMVFGLEEEEAAFLQEKRILQLSEGELPFGTEYGICISDAAAVKYGIHLEDWVTLDSETSTGYVNTLEYQVVGLYRSSSDFDSIYVYMSAQDARELFDQAPEYFQGMRIFLKDPDRADRFAAELDGYLTGEGDVLRAESIGEAGQFYMMIAGFLKSLFTFFVVFILFIIAVGIRSVVRMNLFERMKEFGTLRAIGFNRLQSFFIVFLEIFLLSLIFFTVALVLTLALVAVLERTGIHIGKGAIAYALGGESIYPVFIASDTFIALAVIAAFSLFAPLKPGLKLCCQKITDLLAQNQKPVSAVAVILGSLIRWATNRSRRGNKTVDSRAGG